METSTAPPELMPPTPRVDEIKRTVGPIVKALSDVVSPPGNGQPSRGYRERLGIDLGVADSRGGTAGDTLREEILRRRLVVHAAVYLARENFGCPGLDVYDFDPDMDGIVSLTLDDALNDMEDLDGVGGMEWDAGGRFARFLARRGGDPAWMVAAATIYIIYSRMCSNENPFSRNDLLEDVHFKCHKFTRAYLSKVYEEMFPLLQDGELR